MTTLHTRAADMPTTEQLLQEARDLLWDRLDDDYAIDLRDRIDDHLAELRAAGEAQPVAAGAIAGALYDFLGHLVDHLQAGRGGHRREARRAGQHAARKHILLDEVGAALSDGWYKCSELLPDEGVHVLGYDPSLQMQLVAYLWVDDYGKDAEWHDCTGDRWGDITHWKPLPSDPIEQNEFSAVVKQMNKLFK